MKFRDGLPSGEVIGSNPLAARAPAFHRAQA